MLPEKPEQGGATPQHVAEMEGNEEDVQIKLEEKEQELIDVTEARLEAVMEGKGVPEPEPEPAEKIEDQGDSTPEKKEEKPAEEPDKEADPTPESEVKDEKAEDGEIESKEKTQEEIPPLSDAYYRAGIHRGMTPEVIKAFYEADPKTCIKTLGSIYEAVNRSSKEFAAIGRAYKEQVAKANQQTVEPEKQPEFKGIDIKVLENSDLDEASVAAFKAINEQNRINFERTSKTVPAQETVQPSGYTATEAQQMQAEQREAAVILQQIEGFFDNNTKGYEDFYGVVPKDATDWDALSPGQRMNRCSVVQMMDELIAGANAYGHEITIDSAMQRAHLSVSESQREKVMREELKNTLTERSKSLTLKPSGSAKPEGSGPKTEQDLEDVTQQRLNKLFG